MEFNQAEVKVVNFAIKWVNNWNWIKWAILVLSSTMLVLSFYITPTVSNLWSNNLHIISILLFVYLSRNWSRPTKEALLLKLVKASSAHNKQINKDT